MLVAISGFIVSIVLTAILALRLLHAGRSMAEVGPLAFVMLVFFSLPALGVALRLATTRDSAAWLRDRSRQIRLIRYGVTFILAPVLVGLMYYFTYPSDSLALPFTVVTVVAAYVFFTITR